MDQEQLKQIIKSNLVSYGLLPYQIEEIVEHLVRDLQELIDDRDV